MLLFKHIFVFGSNIEPVAEAEDGEIASSKKTIMPRVPKEYRTVEDVLNVLSSE